MCAPGATIALAAFLVWPVSIFGSGSPSALEEEAGLEASEPLPRPASARAESPSAHSTKFAETFPSGPLNSSRWQWSSAVADAGCGHGHSAGSSLHVDAGENATSRPIDLAGASEAWISLWVKRGDNQGTPTCASAAGDHDVQLLYLNSTLAWNCLLQYQDGNSRSCAGGDVRDYAPGWWHHRLRLPGDAFWSGFRISLSGCCGIPGMDWGVDDVYVWTGAPPLAPVLLRPMDAQRGGEFSGGPLRPEFEFAGDDPDSPTVSYFLQIDDDPTFDTPLLNASSASDPGFADITNGSSDPFPVRDVIRYTPPAALKDLKTYYWRVRATDNSAPLEWGAWARVGPDRFRDTFANATLSRDLWLGSHADVDGSCGYAPGSPPSSLHVNVFDPWAITAPMDLTSVKGGELRFWLKPGTATAGNCTYDSDFGDNLWLEYLTSAGAWQCLRVYYTSGGGVCSGGLPADIPPGWNERWVELPPGALHKSVEFRLRTQTSGQMSWGIDDFRILSWDNIRPPSFRTDSSLIHHRWNQSATAQFEASELAGAFASTRGDGAAEYSARRFHDPFVGPPLDFARWEPIDGTAPVDEGCNGNSGTHSLHISSGSVTISRQLNLSDLSSGEVRFFARTGDNSGSPPCDSAFNDDEVRLEYYTSADTWRCLAELDPDGVGSGSCLTMYTPTTTWTQYFEAIPSDGLWRSARIRFVASASNMPYGVDDVVIQALSSAAGPSMTSPPLRFEAGPQGRVSWGNAAWTESESGGGSVGVAVQRNSASDCSGSWSWTGLWGLFSPIDIRTLNQSGCVRLVANYTAVGAQAPRIDDWEVSWEIAVPPKVTSNSPSDGAVGVAGDAPVTVIFDQAMEPVSTVSAFSIAPPVANGTASVASGILTWTHANPFTRNTTYAVTISTAARSALGVRLASPHVFSFTTGDRPPVVVSTSPAHGSSGVAAGSPVVVDFDVEMDPSPTAGAFSINPAVGGGNGTVSGATLTWAHGTRFLPNTTYVVIISTAAKSKGGLNMTSPHVFSFRSASQPPQVVASSPAPAATGVAAGAKVTVDFDLDMDPASTEAAFSISPDPGGGAAKSTGKSLEWSHASAFPPGTEHTVTIRADAKSVYGDPLPAPHAFRFTTAASPRVSSAEPAGICGDTGADRAVNITLRFTETMEQASTAMALSVQPAVATGSIGWDAGALVWSHADPLPPGTKFWLNVSSAAASQAGFGLDPAFSCAFTTGTGIGSRPPRVLSTFPAPGAVNVGLDSQVIVTFDVAMDAEAAAAFSISPSGDAMVISVLDRNLTMTHAGSPFLPGTAHTVKIAASAKSAAGVPLGSEYTFTFTTQGTAPPVGLPLPQVRAAEALILLLSMLLPLTVLLFLFTRRKKKHEPRKEEKLEAPSPVEEKHAETAPKDVPQPPGDEEPPTKIAAERPQKPNKDPKEINPWDKLEE